MVHGSERCVNEGAGLEAEGTPVAKHRNQLWVPVCSLVRMVFSSRRMVGADFLHVHRDMCVCSPPNTARPSRDAVIPSPPRMSMLPPVLPRSSGADQVHKPPTPISDPALGSTR